jgi:hypothetical protein
MEVYEVVVKAVVTHTFRVIADNQREATERASLMFSNENVCKVLDLKFDVHNDQEPGTRNQEPGTRNQEPGTRWRPVTLLFV